MVQSNAINTQITSCEALNRILMKEPITLQNSCNQPIGKENVISFWLLFARCLLGVNWDIFKIGDTFLTKSKKKKEKRDCIRHSHGCWHKLTVY